MTSLRRIELTAFDPPALAEFYASLDLSVTSDHDRTTITAGGSQIVFRRGDAACYHFALNIAERKIETARDWLATRTALIAGDAGEIITFAAWNAHALYFRDPAGNIGAYEAALMNTPMVNPEQPLEILRTIHSFDPCLACASHIMSHDGKELSVVKVR